MAQGAITYTLVNQVIGTGDSGYMLDLNSDGQADFKLFFDNNNSTTNPFLKMTLKYILELTRTTN